MHFFIIYYIWYKEKKIIENKSNSGMLYKKIISKKKNVNGHIHQLKLDILEMNHSYSFLYRSGKIEYFV